MKKGSRDRYGQSGTADEKLRPGGHRREGAPHRGSLASILVPARRRPPQRDGLHGEQEHHRAADAGARFCPHHGPGAPREPRARRHHHGRGAELLPALVEREYAACDASSHDPVSRAFSGGKPRRRRGHPGPVVLGPIARAAPAARRPGDAGHAIVAAGACAAADASGLYAYIVEEVSRGRARSSDVVRRVPWRRWPARRASSSSRWTGSASAGSARTVSRPSPRQAVPSSTSRRADWTLIHRATDPKRWAIAVDGDDVFFSPRRRHRTRAEARRLLALALRGRAEWPGREGRGCRRRRSVVARAGAARGRGAGERRPPRHAEERRLFSPRARRDDGRPRPRRRRRRRLLARRDGRVAGRSIAHRRARGTW